jgi:DNA-binding winged helix-turn-helix (wHTH) protein
MTGPERYQFGDVTLDAGERRLVRGRAPLHLPPKAFDVLVALVRRAGRLVTKAELLAEVWPDAFVEEGILTVHIAALRKALGGADRDATFIETIPRSGYRFVAPLTTARAPKTEAVTSLNGERPLEAYELVGRGRVHLLAASLRELPDAVSAFCAAIDLDPTYAAAHAGLALARCAQAGQRAMPHQEAYAEAKAAALRALAMDPECADAQVALGTVLYISEWDWAGAERSFRRALEISPNHSEAYLHYGSLMETLGKLRLGLQLKQQALERDPASPLVFVHIATSYWNQRRYDDAIAWAERALAIDPRHLMAREFLAGAYWKKGDFDRLMAENLKQAEAFGMAGPQLDGIRVAIDESRNAFEAGGPAGAARYALKKMPPPAGAALELRFAVLYGQAGELDAAFEHLDRAIDGRDPALVHLAVAPQWDDLRADGRFAERLSRMGLPVVPVEAAV